MIYKSYLVEKDINLIQNKIILLYGENLGLKDDLQSKIKINNVNAEFISLYQEEILKDNDLLFKEILNKSLFVEEKIIFVNQANDKILDLLKIIEKKVDDQKLFIFSDVLEKKSKLRNHFESSNDLGVVPCYPDNEITLKQLAQNYLKNYKGLTNQILNTIVENSGLDRTKLKNELIKIETFFYNKKLEEEELKVLLNLRVNENFNVLKDKALAGDKISTNKLLNETLMETEKIMMYLNSINQRFFKLLEISTIKKGIGLEKAINSLKPPIFWKEKTVFAEQAKKWNTQKIQSGLEKTYKLEFQLKSNSLINKNILIKNLLVEICNLANS